MKNIIARFIEWVKGLFSREPKKEYNPLNKTPKFGSYREWKAWKKKNPLPLFRKPCRLCKNPMIVSIGQIAYYHGACRTKGRQIYAKPY